MESGWERTEAVLTLDKPTIQAMVASVLPAYTVVACERVSGGLANTTYRLTCRVHAATSTETGTQTLALRVYQRDAAACARELALSQRVGHVVPMPEILAAEPSGQPFGWPYSLSRWVAGRELRAVLPGCSLDEKRQVAAALGETLAAISQFTFPAAGFLASDLTVVDTLAVQPDGLLAYLRQQLFECGGARSLGERRAAELEALVTRNAARLQRGEAALLHGDYKPSNLRMRRSAEGWHVAGVMDWEFAFVGDPVFDIGILLRDPAALPASTYADFAQGYQRSGGRLPSDWLPLARMFDIFNLTMFLATSAVESVRAREVRAHIADSMRLLTSLGW